jgi:alkylhydroperoxidase/carboxymuconolactone decarboxylase family protein YurZ
MIGETNMCRRRIFSWCFVGMFQGFALPELRIHIRVTLNCGASRTEIIEVIAQMIAYCGFPAAIGCFLR